MSGKHSMRKPRGMILIVVLWVMVAVSTVCMALAVSARGRLDVSADSQYRRQRDFALQSALNRVCSLLEADSTDFDITGDIWNLPLEANFTVSVADCSAVICRHDPAGIVDYGLVDETSKINANTASAEMLAELPGMNISIATAFVDLRTQLADALADPNSSLSSLQPAGSCGPVSSRIQLAEMLATAMGQNASLGRKMELLDAAERFRNPLDLPADVLTVINYLTIDSRNRNCRRDGSDRVNINTATLNELDLALSDVLNALEISAVYNIAQQNPFDDPAEILVRNLVYMDQFDLPHGISIDHTKFSAIEDRISCDDEVFHTGLININTASREVILALPDIDDSLADAIINRRMTTPSGLDSKSWLLDVLPDSIYATVSPMLTTVSQQFSAMVVSGCADKKSAQYSRCVFQRDLGESSVISVERYTGIWHDPL